MKLDIRVMYILPVVTGLDYALFFAKSRLEKRRLIRKSVEEPRGLFNIL